MRILVKTQNDYVILETNNITFSSTEYIYVRVEGTPLNTIRFGLREDKDDINELKSELLRNGYLDLSKLDIEYYDDWDHRYYKEGEKEKLYHEQQAKQQEQNAVLSEVNAEGTDDK